MSNILSSYGYIGLFLVLTILFTVVMLGLPAILRMMKFIPSHPNKVKNSIFECGVETIGKTWVQFNFRYYFYALVFLALDILFLFIYPWAVSVKRLGMNGFDIILVLVIIVLVGYIYAWRKKVLEWK